jgi:hypothetical protein
MTIIVTAKENPGITVSANAILLLFYDCFAVNISSVDIPDFIVV